MRGNDKLFSIELPLFCWGILKHRSVRRVLYERNRAGPGVGQTIENRSVNCRLLCALGSTCTNEFRETIWRRNLRRITYRSLF